VGVESVGYAIALKLMNLRSQVCKPAFFDDVMGLAIGPLFVLAEMLFKCGLFSELAQEIENRSGPVRP
jgi:uncharacterized membrane protein YGL010W